MKLVWNTRELELREPFRISRSVMAGRRSVELTLEHEGWLGHGEVVTSEYFRLDVDGITDALTTWQRVVEATAEPGQLFDALPDGPPGVRAAADAAVHDLLGKRAGVPVHALLDGPEWTPVPTAYTIGLCAPQDAAVRAGALAHRGFSVLKVKAGDEHDSARLGAIRAAAPEARLLLDPNGAWTPEYTVRFLERTADLRLDAVEQPIPPGTPDKLAWLGARSPVPLIADEDAGTLRDVRGLVGAVDGVNVKLAKCGGLRAAREIVTVARAAGMDVMVGCLVASSLGIAPAVQLTPHARWIDLDGHLLLRHDPWVGLGGEDGTLRLSGRSGLGVVRR